MCGFNTSPTDYIKGNTKDLFKAGLSINPKDKFDSLRSKISRDVNFVTGQQKVNNQIDKENRQIDKDNKTINSMATQQKDTQRKRASATLLTSTPSTLLS